MRHDAVEDETVKVEPIVYMFRLMSWAQHVAKCKRCSAFRASVANEPRQRDKACFYGLLIHDKWVDCESRPWRHGDEAHHEIVERAKAAVEDGLIEEELLLE